MKKIIKKYIHSNKADVNISWSLESSRICQVSVVFLSWTGSEDIERDSVGPSLYHMTKIDGPCQSLLESRFISRWH